MQQASGGSAGPRRRGSGTAARLGAALGLLLAAPSWSQDQGPAREAEPAPAEAAPRQDSPSPAPAPGDGARYPIGRIVLRYLHRGHPQMPKREDLMETSVALGTTPEGYVAPRSGLPQVNLRLSEIESRPPEFYDALALQEILKALRDELLRRGLLGVYVAPDAQDIDQAGRDLRPASRTALRIEVTTSVVSGLRSVAFGSRFGAGQGIDNPAHARIRERSPIRPAVEGQPRRDLLRKDRLDDYVYRLSRHPGRRVDVAISPGKGPGEVDLDYLVTERSPLRFYAQVSNTGTEQTDPLRERFGLLHTQLTNRDDILSLDYMTTSFDEVNAVTAAYEAPFADTDRWRWRVLGSWSEYTAREVGVFLDVFRGRTWELGGEFVYNLYQRGSLFVDVFAGARYQAIRAQNLSISLTGEEDFAIPRMGVRFDQQAEWYRAAGSLWADWDMASATPIDQDELTRLGRLFPDVNFGVMHWDMLGQVYLEPLIALASGAPGAPTTLAHELTLAFRGQCGFSNRLIPQFQEVLGGLYTVRGYPEAVVAGDSAIIANLEYRFHLPRALGVQSAPAELFGRPFRYAPQYRSGPTDWDLVLSAFVDVGRNFVTDPLPFEVEATLLGTGIGVELLLGENFDVRVDWGFALEPIEARGVQAGSSRVHFVASISF